MLAIAGVDARHGFKPHLAASQDCSWETVARPGAAGGRVDSASTSLMTSLIEEGGLNLLAAETPTAQARTANARLGHG